MKIKFYLLAFLIFFGFASPAAAFEISPIKSFITIDPGISQTVFLKIKNSDKTDLAFKLNVFGMRQDENGKPVFERNIDVAENWVYPENNLVNIKSGEVKLENFIIKIPNDALAGSHYLGLSVDPVIEKNNKSNLTTRLVSLLTLEIKGVVQEFINIEKWEREKDSLKKKWKFNLSFKNNGTIEVMSRGSLSVKDWKGKEIFSEPVVLGNKLLAGSRRVIHPEINLNDRNILPGIYSVDIKINYGLTNQAVSSSVYIWHFPGWSKLILLIVILAAVFFIRFFAKKRKKI